MALYSPFQKKRKPVTALDALKPQAQLTPTTVKTPAVTDTPNIYPPAPKQPATAQTALAGGTPPSAVPETTITTTPPLPGKPVTQVPDVPNIYNQNPNGTTPPQTGTQTPATPPASTVPQYPPSVQQELDGIDAEIARAQQRLATLGGGWNGQAERKGLEMTIQVLNRKRQTTASDYERKGQYEEQIGQFNQYVQDELKKQGIAIPDAASVQNNPAYQAAIAAMQSGKSLDEAAALFRQGLPNNYNFQVGDSQFTPNKGTIGDVTQTNLPNINKGEQINVGGTMINRTDLEALLSGDNNLANKASGAALESLMQTLKNGGSLTPEQMKQLTDPFNKDSMVRQSAAESNALGALSARGFGTNASAVTGSLSEIGRGYEAERTQKEADIIKENLMAGIEGKQKATQGLADLASSERQARINAAEIGSKENIAQAGLTSEEKMKQADLTFAQDELYQNGQLSQAGLQLKQNLETYGLQLDKYKTDQGFDLELAKQDLTKQLAQAGLDVDSAKLQADNVFKSLDVAIADKKIDAEVNTAIAELQQRAASGDRDAQFKVDSLRVEQNLRQQGLSNDLAMFTADLAYKIMSGREKLDAEMYLFLKELDAKLKAQDKGGGLGGFLGKIVGTVVGSVAGGVGAAVGNYIGGQLGGA